MGTTRSELEKNAINFFLEYSLKTVDADALFHYLLEVIFDTGLFPGKPQGAMFSFDIESQTMKLKGQRNMSETCFSSLGAGCCGGVLKTLQPSVSSTVHRSESLRFQPLAGNQEPCQQLCKNHCCIPIVHHNKPIGVFCLLFTEGTVLEEDMFYFLLTLADIAAVSIVSLTSRNQLIQHQEILEKKIEQQIVALKSQNRQHEAVLMHMESGLLIVDSSGTILSYNSAMGKFLSCREDEAVGRSVTDIIRLESLSLDLEILKDLSNVTKDAELPYVLTYHKLTTISSGKHYIVALKKKGLPELGMTLHFYTDITDDLTIRGQLIQAQKLEAVGQLAAGVAHEINTPLQFIQNNVTFFGRSLSELLVLLQDYQHVFPLLSPVDAENSAVVTATQNLQEINLEFLLEEIPDAIEEVEEGIEQVLTIVNAMRAFNYQSEAKQLHDINKAISNIMVVSRNEWKHVAEISTDLESDLPLFSCHPSQLNQVLLNLIINAVHAIDNRKAEDPSAPGKITISTRTYNKILELRIRDSGCGIPPAIQRRIFEPFFTTKEVGKGTGQGLSIIRDIVKSHQGSISLQSQVNQGTTFCLQFPL